MGARHSSPKGPNNHGNSSDPRAPGPPTQQNGAAGTGPVGQGPAAASLRVVSLLAGATDAVRALGASDMLVGRTHECDWPELASLPALTADKLGDLGPSDVNDAMSACSSALPTLGWAGGGPALLEQGLSPYRTDVGRLVELRPDVVLTQMQGLGPDVCVGHYAAALEQLLGYTPVLVQLEAGELGAVWGDIRAVGRALKLPDGGEAAIRGLKKRLDAAAAVGRGRPAPRVACIQWPDPLFAAGGWVPQLVKMAGARDVLGKVENSVQFTPQQLAESRPDVVVFALCGYSLEASIKMAREAMQKLGEAAATAAVGGGAADALRRARVVVTDGMHVFSRPGPWLAESLEVLVEALHGEAQVYGHEGKLWVDLGIGAAGAGSGAGGSKAGPGLVAGTL